MKKIISLTGLLLIAFLSGMAQPAAGTSKEQQDLERQRQQLKKELEQVQEMLSKNKQTTKENLSTLAQLNRSI